MVTRWDVPAIEISASPSIITTSASKGAVCSLRPSPASKTNAVTVAASRCLLLGHSRLGGARSEIGAALRLKQPGHGTGEEQHDRERVQQPAPPTPRQPRRKVSDDPEDERCVQPSEMAVEPRPVDEPSRQHCGHDDRRVPEDHGEDEADEHNVQHRIVRQARRDRAPAHGEQSRHAEPGIAREQGHRDESWQARYPDRAPRDVEQTKPQGQRDERHADDADAGAAGRSV